MPDIDEVPYVNMVKNASTPDEIRDIPIIGNIYGTANAIIDFAEYGCFPNWTVWVDTVFDPLGNLILALFDFGMGDILRGYFRPSNLRGVGKLTRAPTRGKRIKAGKTGRLNKRPGIPEVGNSIGKKLPGSKFFAARKVTGLERRFWIIDMGVQRALWYWLVADLTEDFITEWTTAIMQSDACKKPDLGTVSAYIEDRSPTFQEQWSGLTHWTTEVDTTPGLWNGTAGVCAVPDNRIAIVSLSGEGYGIDEDTSGTSFRAVSAIVPQNKGGPTPFPVTSPDLPNEPNLFATDITADFVNPAFYLHGPGVLGGIRNVHINIYFTDRP